MKAKCSKCGKMEDLQKYSYGFVKGKPFFSCLCKTCATNTSDSEYNNLINNSVKLFEGDK